MRNQWFKLSRRLLSLALTLVMVLGLLPGITLPIAAADENSITSGQMTVELDPAFPRVVQYTVNGNVMYGQEDPLSEIIVNDKTYTPTVTSQKKDAATMEYTMTVAEINVVFTVEFRVEDHILEIQYTGIQENGTEEVFSFSIPNQNLVSVRSTQEGADIAYTADFLNNDQFFTAEDAPVNAEPIRTGYTILSTDKLSATIETSVGAYYYNLQTVQKDGYKRTGVWSDYYQYRGPISNKEEREMELPWTRITVVEDQNGDQQIDWQDGAIAFRTIMDELPGQDKEMAQKSSLVNIICSYFGRLPWSWETCYDYLQRQALATDYFPQIVEVKAAHNGIDGDPSYGDANQLLGGNEKLNEFMKLVKEELNGMAGAHTSQHEAYPESPMYEGTPVISDRPGWNEVDREGLDIDQLEYWNTGLLSERYDLDATNWPDNEFLYIDIEIAGYGNDNERKYMLFKIIDKFKEHNWPLLTEYSYPIGVEYGAIPLGSKYLMWAHNGIADGNSDIKRFIMNSYTLLGPGSQNYRNVLGQGYSDYGYLGWWGCGTLDDTIHHFWQYILTDTYLRNFDLLKVFQDPDNNNYTTALFSDGVKAVFDGTYQYIYRDGVLYAKRNMNEQELFVPYEPQTEDKIYVYQSASGEVSRDLPTSWKSLSTVELYSLSETEGRVHVKTVTVEGGKVSFSVTPGQGYVLTKSKEATGEIQWGRTSLVKNMEFNSGDLTNWTTETGTAEVRRDDTSNYYLTLSGSGESAVSQVVTGLEPGTEYLLSTQYKTADGKKAHIQVMDGDTVLGESTTTDYNVTVHTNRLDDWGFAFAHFTAPESGTVTVRLAGLACESGSGEVWLDDLRMVPEENPYGAQGHYYYNDFETTKLNGPFVQENENGINVTATLTNRNDPYTKDVIAGDRSVKIMNNAVDRILKTLPSTLKLEPNTEYTVSLKYLPMYHSADGWEMKVYSQKTDNLLVDENLSGAAWASSSKVITFTTDDADDYRIELWHMGGGGDLVIDDLTVDEGGFEQEIPLEEAFPDDNGTVLIYTHQDDDLIWMQPLWDRVDKFVDGAMPTCPTLQQVVAEQQDFIDGTEYKDSIQYEANWETPFGEISDQDYHDYFWYNQGDLNVNDEYLTSNWDINNTEQTRHEVDKIKEKIRKYFEDPTTKRIITHNIWGEYGHVHHIALNMAVRELAVQYGKDVYMLANIASYDGIGAEQPIPEGVQYTQASFDPELYKGCRQAYINHDILGYTTWTWGQFVADADTLYKYVKIVDGGADMEGKYNPVNEEMKPDENGVYTFTGNQELTVDGTKNSTFTVALSIKPDKAGNMVISTMSDRADRYIQDRDFRLNETGHLVARVWDAEANGEKLLVSSQPIPTDQWTHVALTGDGTTLNLYINGKLDATEQGCAYTGYPHQAVFHVGRVVESYYTGQACDVQVTEEFLSAQQAEELYQQSIASGRIIYSFDGSDDTITVDGTQSTTFTVEMSVLAEELRETGVFTMELMSDQYVQDRELRLTSDGTMTFMVYDTKDKIQKKITLDEKLQAGTWTHVILTGNGETVQVYLNGQLAGEIQGQAHDGYAGDVYLRLGHIYNAATFFKGKLADVAVSETYTDAASAQAKYQNSISCGDQEPEVDKTALQALYESCAALKEEDYTAESWEVLAAAMVEAEKVLADEQADQERVNQAKAALETAKTGLVPVGEEGVLIFDGVDDTVCQPATKDQTFTIAMSVNPDELRPNAGIFTIEQVNDNQIQDREARINADGTITFMIYDAAAGAQKTVTTKTALQPNEWTHILLTGDGETIRVYVNGKLDVSLEGAAYAGYAKDVQLRLGKIYSSEFYKGQMADVTFAASATDDEGAMNAYLASKANQPTASYQVTVIGGTGSGSYQEGDQVTVTANPAEEGKHFARWEAEGIELTDATQSEITFTMPANVVTLTAVYEDDQPVFVPVSNISGISSDGKVGEPLVLNGVVEPAGATNKNIVWSVTSGDATIQNNTLFANSAGTVKVTATIANGLGQGQDYVQEFIITISGETEVTYTVRFDSNGGSAVASQTVIAGQPVIRPADPVKDGYTFTGWYTEQAHLYDFSQPVNSNLTLYAGWKEDIIPPAPGHAISVTTDGNGTVTINPKRAEAGETVTITAAPDAGYEVDSITVTSVTGETIAMSGNRFTMPNCSVKVEVTFRKTAAFNPFADVKDGDWFYEAVLWAYENDVMDGVGGGKFAPNGSVTRAMVWTVLARMDGQAISGSNWMEQARAWAMAEVVSDGTMATGNVTREQLATMLYRYLGSPAVSGELTGYPDTAKVSDWAESAIIWATENGIINGMDGALNPQSGATRAQLAAMLMRFDGLNK